ERFIGKALYERRPVYMAFAGDVATQPVLSMAKPLTPPQSDVTTVQAAADAIKGALHLAGKACILPGILVSRLGLSARLQELVERSGIPFATMFMDKSVLNESQG